MLLRGLDGLPVVGADIVEVAPSYGFADVAVRYRGPPPLGGELLVSCRKRPRRRGTQPPMQARSGS